MFRAHSIVCRAAQTGVLVLLLAAAGPVRAQIRTGFRPSHFGHGSFSQFGFSLGSSIRFGSQGGLNLFFSSYPRISPYFASSFCRPGYYGYPYGGYAAPYYGASYPVVISVPYYRERIVREHDPEPEEPAYRRAESKIDDSEAYYLYRRPVAFIDDKDLGQAVADIESAFRSGDLGLLQKHVAPDETVIVRSRGKEPQSLKGSGYLEMTRDAFREIKTVRYKLNRAYRADDRTWVIQGVHTVQEQSGKEKEFDVLFQLSRAGDRWIISEVGAVARK